MKLNINIRRELKLTMALAVLLVLIAFAERETHDTLVKEISISLDNIEDNHFMDENDVRSLMQIGSESLVGAERGSISIKEIEKRIKTDKFVDNAELYSDLKGNLLVNVELRRPIARIVRNDGPDAYIAEDGTVMPVSEKFTPLVILISGSYSTKIMSMKDLSEHEEGLKLMELLEFVREDDFWRAQIAQLDINSKGNINMMTQVGGETIEFGKADEIEVKFNKLMVYYKDILPAKGWNKYKRVNLEYKDQIVAE